MLGTCGWMLLAVAGITVLEVRGSELVDIIELQCRHVLAGRHNCVVMLLMLVLPGPTLMVGSDVRCTVSSFVLTFKPSMPVDNCFVCLVSSVGV